MGKYHKYVVTIAICILYVCRIILTNIHCYNIWDCLVYWKVRGPLVNMAPGQVFVPFHFNEQLINQLTQPLFCPKSGEPNYKQTAVQWHSEKVPQGTKVKEQEISGALSHEKVTEKSRKVEVKEKQA